MFKKKILLFILVFSVFLGVIIWPSIFIISNTFYEYGDEYFTKNYNKHNDTVRFITFIFVSLTPFFFFILILINQKFIQ